MNGLPVTAEGALVAQLNVAVAPSDPYVGGVRVGPFGGIYCVDIAPPTEFGFSNGFSNGYDIDPVIVPTFSPLSLFAAGEQGAWYDPSDFSTMFQDSAGTTPVTAAGQPVGKILDKSGRGNHATQVTAGNRPTLILDGNGKYALSFNGASQSMLTGNVNFGATVNISTFLGLFKDTQVTTTGTLVQLSSNLGTNVGVFGLTANGSNTTANSHGALMRGSGTTAQNNPTNAAIPPKTFVSNVLYKWAGSTVAEQMAMRVNGVAQTAVGTFTSTAVGACADRPLYFGYNGTNQWFKGNLHSIIVLGRTATTQEITDTETWVADKTGVTLP